MSVRDHETRDAALQLIEALEAYEADVMLLCGSWLDMEHYQSVSQQVDELRLYTAALPRVSVQWAAVLVSHTELIHALWQARKAEAEDATSVSNLMADHIAAIHLLKRAARVLVTRA